MSRIPRWLAPAALAPAAALDAAWALGINGPPAHVIAQTLALPAHAAALAALPAAALAPGRRARQLNAAAALALLGTGVGLLAGDWGGGPRPGDATLTVYSANLEFERSDVSANIEEMLAAGCDVAVFQEVTPDYLRQLRAGLEGCYTEVVSTSRDDALGAAMFARVEVRNATIESAAGSPTPSADVVAGDGTVVRVLGVHTTPPIHGVGPRWPGRPIAWWWPVTSTPAVGTSRCASWWPAGTCATPTGKWGRGWGSPGLLGCRLPVSTGCCSGASNRCRSAWDVQPVRTTGRSPQHGRYG